MRAELSAKREALKLAASKVLAAPRPCLDGVVQKVIGTNASKPLLVTLPGLQVLQAQAREPALPFLKNKELGAVKFTPTDRTETILALSKLRELEKDHPFVVVVAVTNFAPASIRADEFEPARIEGTVTLFKLGHPEALCAEAFSAQNSAQIAQRKGEELSAALETDYELNARKALNDAVHRLSRQLSL